MDEVELNRVTDKRQWTKYNDYRHGSLPLSDIEFPLRISGLVKRYGGGERMSKWLIQDNFQIKRRNLCRFSRSSC